MNGSTFLSSHSSVDTNSAWCRQPYRPVPEVPFISLTVWGYFTNTPQWGVSEIGLALMVYVFAVVGSSGFHTVYSEFSHAFGDRVMGSSVTEMSCVSQNTHCSDVLELRSQVRWKRSRPGVVET